MLLHSSKKEHIIDRLIFPVYLSTAKQGDNRFGSIHLFVCRCAYGPSLEQRMVITSLCVCNQEAWGEYLAVTGNQLLICQIVCKLQMFTKNCAVFRVYPNCVFAWFEQLISPSTNGLGCYMKPPRLANLMSHVPLPDNYNVII